MMGMPLDELEEVVGGESCYMAAEPTLKQLTKMLKENSDGPFFLGKDPSYADFVWLGLLNLWKTLGEESVLGELLPWTGDPDVHLALMKAAEPWMQRVDH